MDKDVSRRLNQHLAVIREECSFVTGRLTLTYEILSHITGYIYFINLYNSTKNHQSE